MNRPWALYSNSEPDPLNRQKVSEISGRLDLFSKELVELGHDMAGSVLAKHAPGLMLTADDLAKLADHISQSSEHKNPP